MRPKKQMGPSQSDQPNTADKELARSLQAALEAFERAGCLVLPSFLGTTATHVVLTPYALRRMRTRNIDASELLELLALPMSSHGRGTTEYRREVAGRIDSRQLRAVYERSTGIAKVITIFQE